ncbi:efflux RND transporter permease subunit [Albibacterium sp.]|uniref:efflux RND transporter permease subunit n=1 Tax=Albibacterium sp. TaxID=2952885 RepID=UPI002CB4C709|nr:efflux RND transporter permease subunit [Albibacterium sp.]HUH19549.1 efflux RND transporter permease subunit [Albibacterium sp.]
MVRFLVERPIAVLVSFFALLLLGISAFLYLPTSLLPEADIPQINISVKMPNSGAKEIELNSIANLRSNLQQLHGLESIESSSSEGEGQIRLVFEHGVNISLAFIEVNEKVDRAMSNLPKGVQRPLVNKVSVADIPIFRLNIYPKAGEIDTARLAELSSFTREIIKRRLEQQPEISMVDISGLSEPQVQIIPKEDYLKGMGISTNHLLQAFQENKINLGSILVKDGHYQYYLQFNSDLLSLREIENTLLNVSGRLFSLKDLAEIRFSHADETGSFYTNGKRGINLTIMKQSSAKIEDLQKSFNSQLANFEKDYPDIAFEVSNDQTELLDFSINNLQQDLLLGGILAFLLMLVFIRQIRAALLIGITIPVSLVISMLGFYFMGININIISLGGLILGLAMIIDNSIVVIDTINLEKKNGSSNEDAAIRGTNDIIRPLITSVLTNCAVFIPLIFLSGLAGAIFYDQAISITIGVISSLLVSILLLPPLYVLFYRIKTNRRPYEIRSFVNVTSWYEGGLSFVFKFPKLTFFIVFILFGSTFVLFDILEKERLPTVSRDDFELFVDWNESIGITENEKRVAHLISEIKGKVTVADAWIGKQQYFFMKDTELSIREAKLYVKVLDKKELNNIKTQLEKMCQQEYPLAVLTFELGKNAFDAVFSDEIPPIRIQTAAFGKREMPSLETSVTLVQKLDSLFPDANINPVALHDKVVLRVKSETALLYKTNISDVNKELESILKPYFVEYFQGAQVLVPVVMLRGSGKAIDRLLSENFIRNQDKVDIPLNSLIEVSSVKEYQSITAGISGAYYPIDIYTEQPEKDLTTLKSFMNQQEEVEAVYTGSYFSNQALIKEMAIIFLISVLLLYFILAAQFESLLQPLFILIELPIAMSGAFIFLYFGNNGLNLMSMIGLIVMNGLIINDSILKIDAINQLRRQGIPLKKAIYDGGHKRLKPIIMITVTSVGALLPTLFMHDLGSELQKPLALALIGGMLIGMLVSLFFVPLIYWLIYKKEEERNNKIKELL